MLDTLLSACKQTKAFAERENAVPLVQKFLVLAQTLESSKAVAFSLGIADSVEIAASTTAEKVAASIYSSPELASSSLDRPTPKPVQKDFLHPLLVALLAFKLGGPINAASTTHQHEWRLPSEKTRGTPSFYSEGDFVNMFEDLRIAVIWETSVPNVT